MFSLKSNAFSKRIPFHFPLQAFISTAIHPVLPTSYLIQIKSVGQ